MPPTCPRLASSEFRRAGHRTCLADDTKLCSDAVVLSSPFQSCFSPKMRKPGPRGRRPQPRYCSSPRVGRPHRPKQPSRLGRLRDRNVRNALLRLDRRGLSFPVNAIARIAPATTSPGQRRDYSFYVRGRPGRE